MWPLGQGQIQTSRQAGGGGGGDGEGASGVRRVVPDEGTVEVVVGETAPGPAPPVARAVHVAAPKSHARRMYTGAVAQTGWARPSPGRAVSAQVDDAAQAADLEDVPRDPALGGVDDQSPALVPPDPGD